jgi:hypothetical protein
MGTKPSGEDLRMRDDEACTGSHFFGFSGGLGEIVVRKLIEHEEDSESGELFLLFFIVKKHHDVSYQYPSTRL